MTLEACHLDEPTGRVTGGVGEDRAGVLAARLVLPPPADDLGDLRLRRLWVSLRHRELRPEDDVVRRHARMAVRVVQAIDACDLRLAAVQVDEAEPLEPLSRLRAVPSGVHA